MSDFESDVMKSLGRIEQKVDTVVEKTDDHEVRIRAIETQAEVRKGEATANARIAGLAAGAVPVAMKAAWDWLRAGWHH